MTTLHPHRTSVSLFSAPIPSALALAFLVGCTLTPGADPGPKPCKIDGDCVAGYACVEGTCEQSGDTARDGGGIALDTLQAVVDAPMSSQDGVSNPSLDVSVDSPLSDAAMGTSDGPTGSDTSMGVGGTGGATAGTGGALAGTGGALVGTGGAMAGTGGAMAGTGGAMAGTGGALVGTGGSTGTGGASTTPITGCAAPPEPVNGSVLVSALTIGSTASYACKNGYTLSGPSQRTCLSDGTWSGTAPVCALVDCGLPETPENGKLSAPTTTFPSTATYSCLDNYGLVGIASRTCQADGTWSGTRPTCQCQQTDCNGRCANLQTDTGNCGACGTVCSAQSPSTAECAAGRCLVTLVTRSFPQGTNGIAVDATHVYWTNVVEGTVMKVARGGGTPTTLASGQEFPANLAVDATHVYWTNINGGTVRKAPLSGGTVTTLASGEAQPSGIVVDATHVYWTTGNGHSVTKVPVGGGTPVVIGSCGGDSCGGIAVDATAVYWTSHGVGKGSVIKATLSGLDPVALYSGAEPAGLVLQGSNLYWRASGGSIMKMSTNGGTPVTLVAATSTTALAADGASVYWATDSQAIMKVASGGGTPSTLYTSSLHSAAGLAVDGTSLYWTDWFTVTKLTPK